MASSQTQIALQMLAQLRRLDPSVSAEVGTPERKILDTVAQSLADSQLDLSALQQSLDVDGKFGDGLDRFLALFGFSRQKATYATGFVTFSRESPALMNIIIPANTQVRVPAAEPTDPHQLSAFYTTVSVTLPMGETEVVAPVRASVAGASSNVAANTITEIVGSPVIGITVVTNETATRNGVNRENDAEYKVRFKNTVFRNLAGTKDQYLALAISTQYSLKANVVGPQSYWREYMQVPPVDDASAYDVNGAGADEDGFGLAGEYTTALASLPYAQALWSNLPPFASNGAQGISTWFYRPDTDFRMNTTDEARNVGDGSRMQTVGAPNPELVPTRPNFTFLNVYTGVNADIQAVRPNDLLLCEFAYMSESSRNDLERGITNAVDVYVDGGNNQLATTVLTAPTLASAFVDNPTSKYHFENYRRAGEPTHRPIVGNTLMTLMWEPVTSLPAQIIVGDNTYLKGTHYWLVEDISELRGSTRARNGIEWSATVKGNSGGTARYITEWTGVNFAPIEIEDYQFDRNIVDLQASLEASKQVTTDVLAHKATTRFFKFDITVMYAPGVAKADINQNIHDAVDVYLKGQYFGAIIQLSDVLQVIHNVDGVDNVRWSSDNSGQGQDNARVWECDQLGKPILSVTAENLRIGTGVIFAKQAIYINGRPNDISETSDSYFKLKWNGLTAAADIDLDSLTLAADIEAALESISGLGTVTVTEDNRSTANDGVRSFTVEWTGAAAPKVLIEPLSHLKGSPSTVLYTDFVLRDSELPALPLAAYTGEVYDMGDNLMPVDTVPGFIIRMRAQSTFVRA